MRPALTWSKLTSITSSGRSATHSRSRSADQRLGSAEPRSPVSYGASVSTSSRFSFAFSPEVWPTTWSSPSLVVEAEHQRADRVLLLAGPPAGDDGVDRPQALDLDHRLALAAQVGRVELLRDHALAARQPGLGLGRVVDERRQLDRAGVVEAAEQLLERRAALGRTGCSSAACVADREQVEGAKAAPASARRASAPATRPGAGGSGARRRPRRRRRRGSAARRRSRSGPPGTRARGSSAPAAGRFATAGRARRRRRRRARGSRRTWARRPSPRRSAAACARARAGAGSGLEGQAPRD